MPQRLTRGTAYVGRLRTAPTVQVISLMDKIRGADGAPLAAAETAGDFFLNVGTNQFMIDGEAAINETEVSVGVALLALPPNYMPGSDIPVTFRADVILAGDAALTAATLDLEAFKIERATGAVGSDIQETAAIAVTATAGDKTFNIAGDGLVPGDLLSLKITSSVQETAAGTGAANMRITDAYASVTTY